MRYYTVYIITNKKYGVIYTGVTSNLLRRIYEHKQGFVEGFSSKYNLKNLVYYEVHDDIKEAIKREKKIKKWKRTWKFDLIEKNNPEWLDLYNSLI